MAKTKQSQKDFFDSLTPEDPAYYSPTLLEVCANYDYKKPLTKRGKELVAKLLDMDWKDVLREYLRNWIKGMQMLHVVSSDFNTGNSSDYQYGWYPHGYNDLVYKKLLEPVRKRFKWEEPTDKLVTSFSDLTVSRNLGFGKSVERSIHLDFDFNIPKSNKGISYTFKVKVYGDSGFYDVFNEYAAELRAEMESFKKEPLLKTDLRPYATYPDISSYKDKKDQLGIIKYYMRNDTEGKGDKCKFTQGFIDAYKDAASFCKALPQIEFTAEKDSFSYHGKKYSAKDYTDLFNGFPEELKYIDQVAEDVLIYKYGLLDTMLEPLSFCASTDLDQFIHNWHAKLGQPITPDIQALIDKYNDDDAMIDNMEAMIDNTEEME